MTYSSIRDLVQDRSTVLIDEAGKGLRTVSLRLEPHRVRQLDLLARHLGFNSRQQITAELITTVIDDALQELSEALEENTPAHKDFMREYLEILEKRLGAP